MVNTTMKQVFKIITLILKSITIAMVSTFVFAAYAKSETMDQRYVTYGVVAGLSEMCLHSTKISDLINNQKIGMSYNLKKSHLQVKSMFEIGYREAFKERMVGSNVIDCNDQSAIILLKIEEQRVINYLN
jgi:hypothetical protein